jgi:hypothetical protein
VTSDSRGYLFRKRSRQPYDWYATAKALYDYWRRDMSDALTQRQRLYPVNWRQHVVRHVPFIWAIARELATAYVQPPSRSFTTADGEPLDESTQRMLADAYRKLDVNAIMRQAHRHLVALNNSTVWVYPHESGDLRLVLMPVHDQEVELSGPFSTAEDDVHSWRFVVPIPIPDTFGNANFAVAKVSRTEAYWEVAPTPLADRSIYTRSATGEPSEDKANPFGLIPVVMVRGTLPSPGEWWAPLATDMLDAQRAVNHDLTDVGHIARVQGYGQPVAVGLSAGAEKEIQLGPETVLGIPSGDGSGFEFKTANPPLAGYVEQLKEYVQQVVAMNGMNPATFMKSSGITALAKQIELMDRESYRREHIEIMQKAEQRLYDVMRAVINWQRGEEVWPEAVVTVEYREPVIPADPLHHVQALERDLAMGQTGRVRARSLRDGISMTEAVARMREDAEYDARVIAEDSSNIEISESLAAPVGTAGSSSGDLDVAATALNGAQMASLQAIIDAVNQGIMQPATARELIRMAVPGRNAEVDRLVATLSTAPPSPPEEEPAPEVVS